MGSKYYQIHDFELQYLRNQLAYEGQCWLVLLDLSCSFIRAQLVLTPEFPFNTTLSGILERATVSARVFRIKIQTPSVKSRFIFKGNVAFVYLRLEVWYFSNLGKMNRFVF